MGIQRRKIYEIESLFFEKIHKIDQTLTRLTKKKKGTNNQYQELNRYYRDPAATNHNRIL